MTFAVMVVIAAGTLGALVLAVRLGRPDPQEETTTSTGRLRLWNGVLAVSDQLKADVELRSKQLLGTVGEAAETFRTDLQSKGIQCAEDAVKAVRKRARADLDDTWPWDRVRFDLKEYTEENLLPLLVKRYDAFRQEMARALVEKLESAVGMPLEKLEGLRTGVGTAENGGSI